MKLESYNVEVYEDNLLFLFFSIGKKGVIPKVIAYQVVENIIYNLSFGDLDVSTGEISDTAVTNNGDTINVMATVVKTLPIFFEKYPKAKVIFKRSTKIRTNLYKRIIREYGKDFYQDYEIIGMREDNSVLGNIDFKRNYTEFSITKKLK